MTILPLKKYVPVLITFWMPLMWCIAASMASAQVNFSGYIRNYNAVQTTGEQEILIGRNRFRLDLDGTFSSGAFVVSNDIQNLYSSRADSFRYRLREAYAELYFARSDLKIGRQMIVWGRADGTFVTDILTPVDLSEFLTQDFPDIRMGVTAISYTRYFGSNYLQLVLNPVFNPNEIPEPGSGWFPRPILPTGIPTEYRDAPLTPTVDDIQAAVRWAFRSSLNFDLDLGVLYWHHPSPRFEKKLSTENGDPRFMLRETFTPGLIAIYSGTLKLTEKLFLVSESAFYHSRSFDYLTEDILTVNLQDPSPEEQAILFREFNANRDGFLKDRPWLISMAGLRYELFNWSIGGQFINEHIFDYDSEILQKKNYHYATLLIQKSFSRDKLDFRTFARYNFTGDDFWINPEITYTGIDAFEASLGGQLFGGEPPERFFGHLSFKNFADNSFGYLRLTAYF